MAIDTYPLEMDVPQLQRVADSMYEFGLTPGAKAPYRVMPEHDRAASPGLTPGGQRASSRSMSGNAARGD